MFYAESKARLDAPLAIVFCGEPSGFNLKKGAGSPAEHGQPPDS
jgi:hypothetical protein